MFSKKITTIAFLPALLSLLLGLGTATVFDACEIREDGTWMHCHEAQTTVVICALILTALLSAAALLQKKTIKIVFYGAAVIAAAVIFLIPGTLIPMCMMQTMRCYTVMQPFVRILSTLIALLSLNAAIQTARTHS